MDRCTQYSYCLTVYLWINSCGAVKKTQESSSDNAKYLQSKPPLKNVTKKFNTGSRTVTERREWSRKRFKLRKWAIFFRGLIRLDLLNTLISGNALLCEKTIFKVQEGKQRQNTLIVQKRKKKKKKKKRKN